MLNVAVVLMLSLTVVCLVLYLKKVNIVHLIVLTVVFATSIYILISGLLFWIDAFSIQRAVLGVIVFQSLIAIILWFRNKRAVIEFEWKRYVIPIIIVLITLPLIWNKYGFYGMGQDEGVYQTHAIQLIYGKNDIQLDFEEYHQLNNEEDKDYYKQELHKALTGYYFYDTSLQTTSEEQKISEVSGTIHGIPTFAAVLALYGRLFSINHMVDVQTIYFICAVMLMYMIAETLNLKRSVRTLVTVLTAISPIILWSAKSSLTEMFLTVLMELYIYGMINFRDKRKSWFSVAAVVTFSFYHFTVYTVFPIFLLLHWTLFIIKREKRFVCQSLAMILGFLAGMCMSCFVAPAYTIGGIIDGRRTGNFKPLYELLPWINENNVLTVVIAACILAAAITVLLLLLTRVFSKLPQAKLRTVLPWLLRIILAGALGMIVFNILRAKTEDNLWLTVLQQSTFIGFSMVTGGIVLAVLTVLWFIKTKVLTDNIQNFIVAGLFIYCILIYSIKLRPTTAYYYYFGRYLAPFVPVLLICAGIFINKITSWAIYTQLILSVLLLTPYLPFFYNASDDTQLSRESLEEIVKTIENNSIVIMSSETGRFLYLPVRTMTGASIYFQEEDIAGQIKELSKNREKVYYITVSPDTEEIEENLDMEVIYRKLDDTGENCEFNSKLLFPFPIGVTAEKTKISCYEVN